VYILLFKLQQILKTESSNRVTPELFNKFLLSVDRSVVNFLLIMICVDLFIFRSFGEFNEGQAKANMCDAEIILINIVFSNILYISVYFVLYSGHCHNLTIHFMEHIITHINCKFIRDPKCPSSYNNCNSLILIDCRSIMNL
jgi:hypothetical protein